MTAALLRRAPPPRLITPADAERLTAIAPALFATTRALTGLIVERYGPLMDRETMDLLREACEILDEAEEQRP